MNKLAIILVTTTNLFIYGLGPLTIAFFLGHLVLGEITNVILLIFWGFVTLVLVISMIFLILGNTLALYIFVVFTFISAGIQVSDELLLFFNSEVTKLDFAGIIDNFIVSIISVWFYFFSDAADYFKGKVK